jgi:hypothetical protein
LYKRDLLHPCNRLSPSKCSILPQSKLVFEELGNAYKTEKKKKTTQTSEMYFAYILTSFITNSWVRNSTKLFFFLLLTIPECSQWMQDPFLDRREFSNREIHVLSPRICLCLQFVLLTLHLFCFIKEIKYFKKKSIVKLKCF